jgi:hypothetical protein
MATSFRASARRLLTATFALSTTVANSLTDIGTTLADDLAAACGAMSFCVRTVVRCCTLPVIWYALMLGGILITATAFNATGHWWTPAVDHLANRECRDVWLGDDNITPLCRTRPGDLSCSLGRAAATKVVDVVAMLRFPDFNKFVLDYTDRLDVVCSIWAKSRPTDWAEYSSKPYHEQACDCMNVPTNPGIWSNTYRVFSSYFYTIILAVTAFGVATLTTAFCLICNWAAPKNTTNQVPLYINWVFNRSKYDTKAAANHTHPFLNVVRSSMRAAVATQFVKGGPMINLFGCRDDLTEVNNHGHSMKNYQVRMAYNAGARTNKGTIMFDTYDGAIGAAVKDSCGRYFLWDSAHFLTANQVTTLLNNGGTMAFNVRQGPIGSSKIVDPISGRTESVVESDGTTWCEQVNGGDAYTHNHLHLPNRDQFCLSHRGSNYLFTRAKLVDANGYSSGQAVYTASQCAFRYSDGDLATYFQPLQTDVRLITSPKGTVIGAVIPHLHDGIGCTRRLTDDEFKYVIQSIATPETARDWNTVVMNKLILKALPTADLDSLMRLAHMLRARQVLTAAVGLPLTWRQAITHNMKIQLMCWFRGVWGRLPYVGHEIVSVSNRVVTECALSEEAAGSNSKEAGPGTDATSGDDTSSSTKRGGQPGGRNGNRRTEAKANERAATSLPPKAPHSAPRGTTARAASVHPRPGGDNGEIRRVGDPRPRSAPLGGSRPGTSEGHGLGGGLDGSVLAPKAPERPTTYLSAVTGSGVDRPELRLPIGSPQQTAASAAENRARVGNGRGKGGRSGLAGKGPVANSRR